MKKPSEKPVGVAALKARLSEYIRAVRKGHPLVVYDRDRPVARIVPYESRQEPLPVRKPVRSLRDIALPAPLATAVNSLQDLLDERQSAR